MKTKTEKLSSIQRNKTTEKKKKTEKDYYSTIQIALADWITIEYIRFQKKKKKKNWLALHLKYIYLKTNQFRIKHNHKTVINA